MSKDDRIFAVVGGGVVTAVAVIAALMWLGTGVTVDAPQRAAVTVLEKPAPAPVTSSATAGPIQRAGLASDRDSDLVREAAARLSAHPEFAAWLIHDRLLRRFVRAVDAIAGGYSPRDDLEFLGPDRPFLVREAEGSLVIAAGSFHRYDPVADVVASLDVGGAVELYRRFEPRLEEIYAEVGWGRDGFDVRFREAVDHLLAVEIETGPFEVEQRAIVYAYADDRFERLSEAQKQLLRMGPDNARRVVAALRELRHAMGWPEPAPAAAMPAEFELQAALPTEAADTDAGPSTLQLTASDEQRAGAPAVY